MEVADDVALGALLKASGARCRLFAGRRTVHLPFYSRVGPAAHSFEKFGTVFEFSLWRPALFVAAQLTLELGLPLWGLAEGGLAALIGAAALLVATLAHVTLSRWLASPLRGALSWPIGALLQAALLLRAAVVTSRDRGIRWRGTLYSREELLEGRRFYAGKLINQHPRDGRSAAASRR